MLSWQKFCSTSRLFVFAPTSPSAVGRIKATQPLAVVVVVARLGGCRGENHCPLRCGHLSLIPTLGEGETDSHSYQALAADTNRSSITRHQHQQFCFDPHCHKVDICFVIIFQKGKTLTSPFLLFAMTMLLFNFEAVGYCKMG